MAPEIESDNLSFLMQEAFAGRMAKLFEQIDTAKIILDAAAQKAVQQFREKIEKIDAAGNRTE